MAATSLSPEALAPILADLSIEPEVLRTLESAAPDRNAEALLVSVVASGPDAGLSGGVDRALDERGTLIVQLGDTAEPTLARWRDALWPLVHTIGVYTLDGATVTRRTLQGSERIGATTEHGAVLVARRRTWVMSPQATVHKFDENASGWDGQPGGAGYPHFRWMRRYVGLFAGTAPGGRILDFGSGAGWCGIEAARRSPGAQLHAFDPSPNMVEIAARNAEREGIDFTGRTGFGEDPPFPAEGEEPYDLVISSGVVSFSPDLPRFFDGIARCVRPGGRLAIGDAHRESLGFRRRRRRRALLPARELNAVTRDEARAALEARGFVHRRSSAYQLTWPIPEAMHVNETRLGGVLTRPLLWMNQVAASLDRGLGSPWPAGFDSWVMSFELPE